MKHVERSLAFRVARLLAVGMVLSLAGASADVAPPSPPVVAVAPHAEALRRELLDPHGRDLVAAHRGDWRNFPENSLPAIRSCISLGVEMAEIDLQLTKDGHLVLMHDATVDRTTNGIGKVTDLTLEDIRALRLKNGYGIATEWTVPTLREALEVARGRILLNLDKGYRYFRSIAALLDETGTTGLALMKGPAPAAQVLAENGDLLAGILYMPVVDYTKPGAAALLGGWLEQPRPPCAVEFVFRECTREVEQGMADCRARGVRIWVNVLWPQLAGGWSDDRALDDPEAVYGELLRRGVSIVQTDRPAELLRYLDAKGRRR